MGIYLHEMKRGKDGTSGVGVCDWRDDCAMSAVISGTDRKKERPFRPPLKAWGLLQPLLGQTGSTMRN